MVIGEVLPARREHEDVGIEKALTHVVHVAMEGDIEVGGRGTALQVVALRSVAVDVQMNGRRAAVEPGTRVQQHVDALVGLQPRRGDQSHRLVR